jgi:hypothetical protein
MTHPRRVPILQLVTDFDGAVYGLFDDFRGLKASAISYSHDTGFTKDIGLRFTSGPTRRADCGVLVETKLRLNAPALAAYDEMEAKVAAFIVAFDFGPATLRRDLMGKSPFDGLGEFPSNVLSDFKVQVKGLAQQTNVWLWQVPKPVHSLVLDNGKILLIIATYAFDTADLGALLSHVGPINGMPDAIARYEAELKANGVH